MKRFLYAAPALAVIALSPRTVGILGAVVMIAGLIFLHELGHFLMAKRMGMPVETFSLGFGPRLIGFRWRETDVRLSALPLGGYVKLSGYNPEEPDAEDPHGFLSQPYGKRMLFYSGGILANLATALVLLCILGVDQSRATVKFLPGPLAVSDVLAEMPAGQAGLKAGDEIRVLGELNFPGNDPNEAKPYIEKHAGMPLMVRVDRAGQPLEFTVTPKDEKGLGRVGIIFGTPKVAFDRKPIQLRDLGHGIAAGALETGSMAWMITKNFGKLVSFRANYKEVGGPIAIAKAGSDAAKAGWERFLLLCAFISVNLAVLNALPIPFLDGGHMAILSFEKLRKRDLTIKTKERILTGGFFFLISLMVLVIAMDILRLRH
ncbi:MAG: site-2 protease family protein [Holophaga sp.]|nr:site-2 protease family protein [Holophaga sp.]